MKIKHIEFGDDELPETVTIQMDVGEAARLAWEIGNQPGVTKEVSDLYGVLAGSVFNPYYDEGVPRP